MIYRNNTIIECDRCKVQVTENVGNSIATHRENLPTWHIGMKYQFCPTCRATFYKMIANQRKECDKFLRGEG